MYTEQCFVFMALDPLHIGTGGYRLGRVDLSIAREAGTNLPKVPGTSLSGAARAYAAYRYGKPQCAGQGQEGGPEGKKGHCRDADCAVCYTFGRLTGAEGSQAGRVSIGDGQVLLFPAHSFVGPVWVTTRARLAEAGFGVSDLWLARGEFATTLAGQPERLNLGWLLLARKPQGVTVDAPRALAEAGGGAWQAVQHALVLVDDSLFSEVVNSNLEVRTSVSIDPITGAAKAGALFTYEALPRATWLWAGLVEDDYRPGTFPADAEKAKQLGHRRPLDVVREGLRLAEYLGVGGMGTRGFGRLRLLADWEVSCG